MKFYNPLRVQDQNGSIFLGLCLATVIIVIIGSAGLGLVFYPAITASIIVALVIGRIMFAIIKGD